MNALVVVGTFNESGGKVSYTGQMIAQAFTGQAEAKVINGGDLTLLDAALDLVRDYKIVVWMPNVDNSVDKYLPLIKENNPTCLLVSSKRVIEKTYTEFDVVGRLLKSKSNLGIMITRDEHFNFKLIDPLGNLWSDTSDIVELGSALVHRLRFLATMTRVPSVQLGDAFPFSLSKDYLEVVRHYGAEFSKYVNAINPNRFLGNTATRCMAGFPGMRGQTSYFISRRNVDKENISDKDFVEVSPREDAVEYFGTHKPSVDTPIQVRLFNHYPNVKYIIHGHVYITGANKTERALPCGAVEEFEEIKSMMPFDTASNFVINLRGHGCLILATDLEFFKHLVLESRPFPEVQEVAWTAVS